MTVQIIQRGDAPELEIIGDRNLEALKVPISTAYHGWLHEIVKVNGEIGYPAALNGQNGFLITYEFWHTGMSDELSDYFKAHHAHYTPEAVLKQTASLAEGFHKFFSEFPLRVHAWAGGLESHELQLFVSDSYPAGMVSFLSRTSYNWFKSFPLFPEGAELA